MIENIRQSVPVIVSLLKKRGEKVTEITLMNKQRHLLVEADKTYWVVFKRETFHSFGRIFGFNEGGETLNEEILDYASERADYLLFIYPNESCYSISAKEFESIAKSLKTRRILNNEITWSIPLSSLKRFQ